MPRFSFPSFLRLPRVLCARLPAGYFFFRVYAELCSFIPFLFVLLRFSSASFYPLQLYKEIKVLGLVL